MPNKVTISTIKCDVGSLAGHYIVPKPLFDVAEKSLKTAAEDGVINNFYVFNAGDDLELLMVHEKGEQNPEIHKLGLGYVQRMRKQGFTAEALRCRSGPFEDRVQRKRPRDGSGRCRNRDRGTRV